MKKVSLKDLDNIKELPILLIYRKSLILLKNYPSIKRKEIREAVIEDYHEFKNLTDEDEIKKAHKNAWSGLSHLILYELKRQEFLDDSIVKVDTPVSSTYQYPQEDEETKKKMKKKFQEDEKFEYF